MEAEVTRYGSHTESRMRENCTYGSMRGRAYPAGASRSTLQFIDTPLSHFFELMHARPSSRGRFGAGAR